MLAALPRYFWPCPSFMDSHNTGILYHFSWVGNFMIAKSTMKIMKISTPQNYPPYYGMHIHSTYMIIQVIGTLSSLFINADSFELVLLSPTENGCARFNCSFICCSKPSIVENLPPSVPDSSRKSNSGIAMEAVSA